MRLAFGFIALTFCTLIYSLNQKYWAPVMQEQEFRETETLRDGQFNHRKETEADSIMVRQHQPELKVPLS